MLMKAQVLITKENGTSLPDADRIVGPINNVCSSLFSAMRMFINGEIITKNQTHYAFKNYVQNLLSYPDTAKSTNLHLAGWCTDTPAVQDDKNSNIDPCLKNYGFIKRTQWFREQYQAFPNPWRTSGYTFLAPFRHELNGITKFLVPETVVHFELERSSHAFSLMRIKKAAATTTTDDVEPYKLVLVSCTLFVKTAQLSIPLWREIKSRHQQEPIRYYFRRLTVKVSC